MKNLTIKSLAAAVVYFFGGWLIYGILLDSYFEGQCSEACKSVCRPEEEMIMQFMVLGSLLYGILVAYINQAKQDVDWKSSAMSGAIVGVLFAGSTGFMNHSMMDMSSVSAICVDMIVCAVLTAAMSVVASMVGND